MAEQSRRCKMHKCSATVKMNLGKIGANWKRRIVAARRSCATLIALGELRSEARRAATRNEQPEPAAVHFFRTLLWWKEQSACSFDTNHSVRVLAPPRNRLHSLGIPQPRGCRSG